MANDPKNQFGPRINDSSRATTVLQSRPTPGIANLTADAEARISRLSENSPLPSIIEKPQPPKPEKPSAPRKWSLKIKKQEARIPPSTVPFEQPELSPKRQH
jgi:hypothetical protein